METSNNDDRGSVVNSSTRESIVPVREKLVATAAQFLRNPDIRSTPLELRKTFLKKKGLTDEEVNLAVAQSEDVSLQTRSIDLKSRNSELSLAMPGPPLYPLPPTWPLRSRWTSIRDTLNAIALIGGVVCSLYYLYQNFMVVYLFGGRRKPRERSVEAAVASLDVAVAGCVQEVRQGLGKVQQEVERLTAQSIVQEATARQIQDIKAEIASLKGLLLNRHQFPSTPQAATTLSIPSWQLSSGDGQEEPAEVSNKEAEEESSGSDLAGTNGSDSSLEMIKSE